MRERLAVPETTALVKRLLDFRVGVEHTETAKELHGIEKMSGRSDRRENLEAVPRAGRKVVGAVARRGMDGPCTGLEGDIRAQHANRIAFVQRMPEPNVLEDLALHLRDGRAERSTSRRRDRRRKRLRDDDGPAIDIVRRVTKL